MKKIIALLLCVALCFTLGISAFADTDTTTTEVVTSEAATSDVETSEAATSDVETSEAATSDVETSEAATSDVETSEAATSDPATSDPASSEPATSDPASSDPATSDPATSEPETSDAEAIFPDVAEDYTFYNEIYWCADNGYMLGYKDGNFRPTVAITRAQVATVFWRYAGSPADAAAAGYADSANIASDYVAAVNWAKAENVMIGYADNCFKPNQAITREEFVTVFYRYLKIAETEGSLDAFADAASVKAPFVTAMKWAVANNIIEGFENKMLAPQDNLSRGQMAAIIYRCAENVPTSDVPASDVPASDVPASDVPASDVPASDVPASDVPASDVPASDVPATDVPASDVPATDAPSTDVPSTDAPSTDAPSTDVPATAA